MNERAIQLVNAEIDGELSGPERAELNRLLLADPEVRALRDGLARTCAALDSLESLEVPADLHGTIISALPDAPIPCADEARFSFLRRPAFRYAATFAGGLLASALVFQAGVLRQDGLDSTELTGTIASVASDPSRIDVDLPQARGVITLEGTAAAPVVQTRLTANQPIRVIARADGREVRMEGFVAAHHDAVEMSAGFGAGVVPDAPIVVELVDPTSGSVLQSAELRSSSMAPNGK